MSNRLLGVLLTVIVALGLVGLFLKDKPVRLTFTIVAVVLAIVTLVAYRRSQRVKWKPGRARDDGFGLVDTILALIIMALMSQVIVVAVGSDVSQAAIAACQADGTTLETSLSQFTADNPLVTPTTPLDLTNSTPANTTPPSGVSTSGYPFLQSWPTNTGHYWYGIGASATTINTVVFSGGVANLTTLTVTVGTADIPGLIYLAPAVAAGGAPTTGWVVYNGPASCTGGTGNATIK